MGRKIFAALITVAFLYITSSLIFPMAMGGVLAALFSPWADRLEKSFEKKLGNGTAPKAVASAILTLGITVVLILPISFLISFLARAGFRQIQSWKPMQGQTQGLGMAEGLVDSV